MNQPLISIVTAVYNGEKSILQTLNSVAEQSYSQVQHVVVDGASKDSTVSILQSFHSDRLIWNSAADRGIYDALNHGIQRTTGEIVGLLHSDDFFYSPDTLKHVATAFLDESVDVVYGDLVYVDEHNPNQIKRYWKAGTFNRQKFKWGWMPPHPTVYVRRRVLEKYGDYRLDCGSAADYEWILRVLFVNQTKVVHIPEVLVAMRTGGTSNATLKNRLKANFFDQQAWTVNGLSVPWGLRFTKPIRKIPQYFQRPIKL